MRPINPAIYSHQVIKPGDKWIAGTQSPTEKEMAKCRDFLGKHTPGRILDWGCRTGVYMDIMKEYGYEATGLEVQPKYVRVGQAKGRAMVCGDATYTDEYLEADYFDYVWSHNLLEHLDDPRKALESLRKVMKLGGKAYLIFPSESRPIPKHRYVFPNERSVRNTIPEVWKLEGLFQNKNKVGSEWTLQLGAI